ncbi:hypothetical protein KO481_42610 [Nocardia sp. NEAU-G5]|uniref:Uncharacterized protein n=1 Tax=Nocardia albiluteola TaxID=2842303 RepID=A0ABS6BD27_9NOCA|nr:hypothetical protein [Nocardia albiluteola]MBU3068192.1 hypothetical protein [Nocardia albiluteola]
MTELPQFIDGARVLRVATLLGTTPTGRARHTIGGHVVDGFAGLAIAQYDTDPGVHLFYCDAAWNCVTDTWHDDVAGAVEQARYEFDPIEFVDVPASDTTAR